jgi:hypothetical protein
MKATDKQREAIQTFIDTLESLKHTNDISSPSHYVDSDMEIAKLELPRDTELILENAMTSIIIAIKRIQ